MKQKDWTQQLRQQLADHEEVAPEGLWADIETTLEQQSKRPVPLAGWRRWTIAAAVIGFVAGGSYLLWPSSESIVDEPSLTAQNLCLDEKVEKHDDPVKNTPNLESVTKEVAIQQKSLAQQFKPKHQTASALQQTEVPLHITLPQEDNPKQDFSTKQATDEQQESLASASNSFKETIKPTTAESSSTNIYPTPSTKHSNLPSKLSVRLYASNYSNDCNHSNQVQMSPQLLHKFTGNGTANSARQLAPVYLKGYKEQQHHYQPLSLGVTLDYALSQRWSVSTGVVYTWQRSEFIHTMPNQVISTEQKLQYVGIPLALHCRLWQYQQISFYCSAGIQADFNVDTQVCTNGIEKTSEKDCCQWSVGGSLGVAYNFLPQLSLYVEPGAKHYFDNGSHLQNFFKDKPTSFNLQLGVRLHF